MQPLSWLAGPSEFDEVVGLEAIERSDIRPAFWDEAETSFDLSQKASVAGATLVLGLPLVVVVATVFAVLSGSGDILRSAWVGPVSIMCCVVVALAAWDSFGRLVGFSLFVPPAFFRRALAFCVERSVLGVGSNSDWTAHRVIHDANSALGDLGVAVSQAHERLAVAGADQAASGPRSMSSAEIFSGAAVEGTVDASANGTVDHSGRFEHSHADGVVHYTAKRGDTWWGLAESIYGDGLRWTELRDLNLAVDGKQLTSTASMNISLRGKVLILPSAPKLGRPPEEAA